MLDRNGLPEDKSFMELDLPEFLQESIDLKIINSIIEDMPVSDLQKQFYKVILKERKEKILDFSYNKLISAQSNQIRKMNIEV